MNDVSVAAAAAAREHFTVPPDPRQTRGARERIRTFAAGKGLPQEELADFLTAFGEALANAVEHSQATEPLEVSVWIAGRTLYARVFDRGIGFVPPPAARAGEDPLAERGRGLPIMRRCVDVFTLRSAPGRGTVVTLGRRVRRARG